MKPVRLPWLVAAVLLLCGLGAAAAWAGLSRLGPSSAARARATLYDDVEAGRLDRGESALAWLAAHDRLTPQDLMARARIAHARGRLDEALAALGAISDDDELAPPARLQAARIELARDRSRDAEAALKAVLKAAPQLTPARLELIRLYARQQRLEELDAQFDVLVAQHALDFSTLSFWTMTRNLRWEPEADVEVLRKAVAADPDDRASRLALVEGLKQLGRGAMAEPLLAPLPSDDPDARSLRAALALDRSDLDEAARLIAEGSAGHAESARMRGLLAMARHDLAGAVDGLREAVALQPNDRRALYALGTALTLVGRDAEAASYLESSKRYDALTALTTRLAEETAPTNADLHRLLGAANEAVGRLTEARAWYRLAIDLNPLDAEAQRGLYRLAPREEH